MIEFEVCRDFEGVQVTIQIGKDGYFYLDTEESPINISQSDNLIWFIKEVTELYSQFKDKESLLKKVLIEKIKDA